MRPRDPSEPSPLEHGSVLKSVISLPFGDAVLKRNVSRPLIFSVSLQKPMLSPIRKTFPSPLNAFCGARDDGRKLRFSLRSRFVIATSLTPRHKPISYVEGLSSRSSHRRPTLRQAALRIRPGAAISTLVGVRK